MSEFINGLQAASNAAASNVSGPVDIIGWLLRKAGVPVPDNSLLSSQWLAQQGLTAPVRQGASQVVGETLGLLGPIAAAAKAPQIARGLLAGGENLAAPRTLNPQRGVVAMPDGAKRMEIAQRNAAKPVSEGGLGLGPNNTAAERAAAMGFDTEFQHGSPSGDITAFDIAKTQKSDAGYMGQGIYGTELGATAYADGTVYPLLTKSKGARAHDMTNWNAPDNPYTTIANRFGMNDLAAKQRIAQEYRQEMMAKGYHGIIDRATPDGTLGQVVVYDPAHIRSRFAAFDPARSSEADILGGADPYLLALLGLGAGGLAYSGQGK